MAMSVGGEGGDDAPMSDINTTPLVDVMLVLLIIFLITIPVAIDKIDLKVPDVRFQPTITKVENVLLSVRGESDGTCGVYWGNAKVSANQLLDLAAKKFKNEADRLGANVTDPNLFPEVHIRGDRNTPYRCIGGAVSIMQSAGFIRVGFISEPIITA
ncbi:MAG: ExbD/TolR family protein [Sphingomonadaceae bacterium]